ncbi:amino acid adenylation domain-containing protein [Streptomyces flaveolus]|uniref:amino acid adenylation domain-containing protein n=1 Tax=Streptomyces flaveolus TaxID=67297 RepID=UPI0034453026
MTLRAAVREASAQSRTVLRHERYRYGNIYRDRGPSAAGTPMFGPTVNFYPSDEGFPVFGRCEVASRTYLANGAVEDLTIVFYQRSDSLRTDFHANPALYSGEETCAHHNRFLYLLGQWAKSTADTRIAGLQLVSAEERRRLLTEWSGAAWQSPADTVPEATVAEAFEARAARTPTATALVRDGVRLTYAELNARANRLARLLRSRGARPAARVGVLMDRSAELIITLLAVLKTGAAYVPFDPASPLARIRHLVEDTRPALILTAGTGTAVLPGGYDRLCLDIRAAVAEAEHLSGADLAPCGTASHPAYVMYTSGSTGRPKGVVVPHRAVTALAYDRDLVRLGTGDVVAQAASAAFDAATFEIWGALLNGATLAVAPAGVLSVPELRDFLKEHQVTVLWLTAGLFHEVVDADVDALKGLRCLLAGGDVLSPAHCQKALDRFPALRLVNGYGPTENTTFTAAHPVRLTDVAGASRVPIGRPVAGSRIYVLDSALAPVPPGATGELYAAGPGVALGYLGSPGRTAERFVPDPYGPPGARMYRTGDLVRWSAQGELEFLGRADDQVKIRGFRVEPGEIEAVLRGRPEVARSAVVVRSEAVARSGTAAGNGAGDKRLVAYVVPAPGADVNGPALRTYLSHMVPDHMVPSAVVVLDTLPLTVNGKLDRAALPAPDHEPRRPGRAPATDRERMVCALFAHALGIPDVGVDDNFFEHGGHSLLALRLISGLESETGARVGLGELFERPTPAALAVLVEDAVAAGAGDPEDAHAGTPTARTNAPGPADAAVPAESEPDRTPTDPTHPTEFPLALDQGRLWLSTPFGGTEPTYVARLVRFVGRLDADALRAALAAVVDRQQALRTLFPVRDGRRVQRVVPAGEARVQLYVQRREAAELHGAAGSFGSAPYDPEHQLPLLVALFDMGEAGSALLVKLYHTGGDNSSIGVLIRDLAHAYTAAVHGRELSWKPLTSHYTDYALRQRDTLGGLHEPESEISRQLNHWERRLGGIPPEATFTPDRARTAVADRRGDSLDFTIPPAEKRRLARFAADNGVTLFMVVQAGLAVLMSRNGAGDDIPLGCPLGNREDEALEHLVGFFTNVVVLRVDTSGNPSFRQLVQRIRRIDAEAFAHRNVPFERIAEALGADPHASLPPVVQVMLDSSQDFGHDLTAFGVDVLDVQDASKAANFNYDVILDVQDRAPTPSLTFRFRYATELYDRATVEGWAAELTALLSAAMDAPDAPLTPTASR